MSWCVGIEDTCIGQPIRWTGYALDEYELTQHYRFWRQDLDLAASLGVAGVRYGIPWYRVNPEPDRFDWRWTDEVLDYAVRDKRLTVIADLVHYGVPIWLEQAFVDPSYPEVMSRYAAAFAERYRGLVDYYTPLNEPTVTADFCGQRGLWPPYRTGNDGWVAVTLAVAKGLQQSVRAIRAANARATIVHVEAAKVIRRSDTRLRSTADQIQERAFLPTDLFLGRIQPGHQMSEWLITHGASEAELLALSTDPPTVDFIGVNYYPEISVRELALHKGVPREVAVDGWASGLVEVLSAFYERYGLPLIVSETSTDGEDDRRTRWLRDSVTAVEAARLGGVDVRGFTWWPLIDFVDWSWAIGAERMEDFLVRVPDGRGGWQLSPPFQPSLHASRSDIRPFFRSMGLYRLHVDADGVLARVETPTAQAFRDLIATATPMSLESEVQP